VKLVRDEEAARVRGRAKDAAEERVLDLLLPRASAATASASAPASRGRP
jgi:ATP-dependent protease HslVU (ClpYQ) ATPase subunit